MSPGQLLFGRVRFRASEEYLEFQFKFLAVIVVVGALVTGLFVVANALELNPLDSPHVHSMKAFTVFSCLLWFVLRGRKRWFLPVAWTYEAACLLEYLSTLVHVPSDELRIFWFITNVPGVFILLGKRAGWAITSLSVAIVVGANPYDVSPYSQNALATFSIGMFYLALFFHIYTDRSISYFVRMRESNRQLRHMATHDTLTGVLNARAYYDTCDRLIEVARRNGSSYAVLFVDLDHFKSINDTHGHAAGDIVLKSVAGCLAGNIRKSDALGRIGGEEFSIFLSSTDEQGGVRLAEAIRLAIEELMPCIGGQHLRITASIGLAIGRSGGQTMLEIQQRADQAMYEAKAGGRNRVSVFVNTFPS